MRKRGKEREREKVKERPYVYKDNRHSFTGI